MFQNFKNTFHLSRKQACDVLGISTTTIKQRCRDLGITRWPVRKLMSIRTHLAALTALHVAATAGGQATDAEIILSHIRMIKQLEERIYNFPDHPIPSFIKQMAQLKKELKRFNQQKRRAHDE